MKSVQFNLIEVAHIFEGTIYSFNRSFLFHSDETRTLVTADIIDLQSHLEDIDIEIVDEDLWIQFCKEGGIEIASQLYDIRETTFIDLEDDMTREFERGFIIIGGIMDEELAYIHHKTGLFTIEDATGKKILLEQMKMNWAKADDKDLVLYNIN